METVINSGIKLQKPLKQEGLNSLDTNFFPNHFTGIIVGKPGDGKTTFIKTILKEPKIFFKKFNCVLVLSPSFVEFNDLFLPSSNIKDDLDFSWIYEKIEKYKNTVDYVNVLIIIDDLVSELKNDESNAELKKLIWNRRHLLNNGMLSILISTQKYKGIPAIIRVAMNVIIVFRLSPKEIKSIQEELIYSDIDFDKICSFVFKEEGNFLIYNIKQNIFFKNFDQIKI
jgi:hypothetical protein